MPLDRRWAANSAAVLVLALLGLVHDGGGCGKAAAQGARGSAAQPSARAKTDTTIRYTTEGLPAPVIEMRDAILAAVRSGQIEDLRTAVELNELKPAIADGPAVDPIAYWRQVSGDGEGREILAVLGQILDAGFVELPLGRDLENNKVFVWPYFAETGIANLSPAQEVELLRLVPGATFNAMKKAGRYTHYKLGIGADGTWHFFMR